MYSEGSPAVKQSNETAFSYFKKAADKVNRIHRMKEKFYVLIKEAGWRLKYTSDLPFKKR